MTMLIILRAIICGKYLQKVKGRVAYVLNVRATHFAKCKQYNQRSDFSLSLQSQVVARAPLGYIIPFAAHDGAEPENAQLGSLYIPSTILYCHTLFDPPNGIG